VYRHFAECSIPPTVEQIRALVGGSGAGRATLQRLHEDHTIVIGSIPISSATVSPTISAF
jgi:hypothetical protein